VSLLDGTILLILHAPLLPPPHHQESKQIETVMQALMCLKVGLQHQTPNICCPLATAQRCAQADSRFPVLR
jgi:hypothetical protein